MERIKRENKRCESEMWGKIETQQILILCLVLSISTISMVYALMVLWQAPGRITIVASPKLSVYWDSSCTQPVTSIDLGERKPGDRIETTLYIKNEGSVEIVLEWSSDLYSTTKGQLGDIWLYYDGTNWQDIKGYRLKPGDVLKTRYDVVVAKTAPAGTYAWALQLGSM